LFNPIFLLPVDSLYPHSWHLLEFNSHIRSVVRRFSGLYVLEESPEKGVLALLHENCAQIDDTCLLSCILCLKGARHPLLFFSIGVAVLVDLNDICPPGRLSYLWLFSSMFLSFFRDPMFVSSIYSFKFFKSPLVISSWDVSGQSYHFIDNYVLIT